MENYASRVWNFVPKPLILLHDEGYYIFAFKSDKDKEKVLKFAPYYYNNKLVILKQ